MATDDDRRLLQALYGQHAVHVPGWLYVQDQGGGVVCFAGASRVQQEPHPLRYGSTMTHQFILGELIVRPHSVIETERYRGHGVGNLLRTAPDPEEMLQHGSILISLR